MLLRPVLFIIIIDGLCNNDDVVCLVDSTTDIRSPSSPPQQCAVYSQTNVEWIRMQV